MSRTRPRQDDRRKPRLQQAPKPAARTAADVDRGLLIFHWIVIAGAAATVLFTWSLWQLRSEPPMIALLPLPALPTGAALLTALALAAVRPGLGLAAYATVLGYAIATDATRLQPALVSFALLLAARLPGTAGLAIARAHVVTLWFYAGFHKLLSPDFMAGTRNPWMLRAVFGDAPHWMREIYPASVVAAEVGLALAAVVPRTRRLAALWAVVLHASILLPLSPIGHDWNRSVWAWNAVLACCGVFLIAPWRESIRHCLRSQNTWSKTAIVFLVLYPAAWQIGIGDPYLAHQLYAESAPLSYVCRTNEPPPSRPGLGHVYPTPDGRYQCRFVDFFPWLNVPEPGEHWFARRYFERTCAPGEILFVRERRRFFLARGQQWDYSRCPRRATANTG